MYVNFIIRLHVHCKKLYYPISVESPATFETPINKPDSTPNSLSFTPKSTHSDSSQTTEKLRKAPSDGHTLDSFLSTFTSEDNNSFQEIIETADKKLRQKFAVLYNAETSQAKHMAMALALPGIEEQFQAIDGPKQIDTWTYKNKNYIMYVPDGVDLTTEEKLEMAKRKQEIVYNNTRLQSNPFDDKQSKDVISEMAKTQAKGLNGKIGVDGNTMECNGEPNIRGFGFVKTPSPSPGGGDTPFMTWGEIEGTPFRLDGSDTPIRPSSGPSFRITETSRRENIALELAEKAGERMRGQKAKAIEAARRNIASPHIRSTFDRLATMSPAAKRLASSRLGIQDSTVTPSPNHRRSTPTPKIIRKFTANTTPSPLVTHRRKSLPLRHTPASSSVTSISSISSTRIASSTINDESSSEKLLTDDLLNIPGSSRSKAADFF